MRRPTHLTGRDVSTGLTTEAKDVLQKTALMSALSAETAALIASTANQVTYSRGATIFHRGDPVSAFYAVVDGWVKISRVTQTGNEAVLAVYTRGQSFAEAAVFLFGAYPANAEAACDTTLVKVPSNPLKDLILAKPDIALAMLGSMSRHLHELVGDIEALKTRTGVRRVADFLLSLSRIPEGGETIMLPFEKSLIAAKIGITPESLSRAFSRLRGIGIEARNGHVDIADVSALRAFAKGD